MISKNIYILILLSNLFFSHSFIYSPYINYNKLKTINMISNDNDLSYLDKINKPSSTVKKLENMKKNITNFLKENKSGTKKIEKGYKSTYMPIPKSDFDNIFLNINNIITIFMSANMDRVIFVLSTDRKYVFYINTKEQLQQMEQLINILPNKNVKKIIINDVMNIMDDPFGFLYCEKNK